MQQRFFVSGVYDVDQDYDKKYSEPWGCNHQGYYLNLKFKSQDSLLRQLYDHSDVYDIMTVFDDSGRLFFYKHDDICYYFARENDFSDVFHTVGDPRDYIHKDIHFFTILNDVEEDEQ